MLDSLRRAIDSGQRNETQRNETKRNETTKIIPGNNNVLDERDRVHVVRVVILSFLERV